MNMYSPAHPGEILKNGYLEELNITITDAAKLLSITRKHLSNIVNAKAGITPDIGKRLALWTNTRPQFWLDLQSEWDLWQIRNINYPIKGITYNKSVATLN